MKISLLNKPPIPISKEIRIDIKPLLDLALNVWRVRNKIEKLKGQMDEEVLKPIAYSIQSSIRDLESIGIEIKSDYNQKIYQNSMNVEVISYESIKMTGSEAIVKETLEPAILFQNQLVHKAKVIIAIPKD